MTTKEEKEARVTQHINARLEQQDAQLRKTNAWAARYSSNTWMTHFNFAFLHQTETCVLQGKAWRVVTDPAEVDCATCRQSPYYREFCTLVEVGYDGDWRRAAAALHDQGKVR